MCAKSGGLAGEISMKRLSKANKKYHIVCSSHAQLKKGSGKTLWLFLKNAMIKHGDKRVFSDGTTYADLLKYLESEKINNKNRVQIAQAKTRKEQAISILKIISSGKIVVPLDVCSGDNYNNYVRETLNDIKKISRNVAMVLFTSGTTGRPKGVMLSHINLIENILGISEYFTVHSGQVITICRPLIHSAVLTGELLFGIYAGLEITFYEEAFQPKRLVKFLENSKSEILGCTPTMLFYMLREISETKLTDIVISGEKMSRELPKLLREKLPNVRVFHVYGLTENSPRVSALPPDQFDRKPESVGKAIRHTKIKIVDGEIWVRSTSVMLGYLGDPIRSASKLSDGYLHTGDVGEIDAEGDLYIRGRKDEMMIRAGVNIYPAEIENAVRDIEGILDCMVYGKDDVKYGQKICLEVSGCIALADLRKELLQKLPSSKIPDEIYLVEGFEWTPSGKKRRVLKSW